MTMGKRIRAARKAAGMTQVELAKAAGITQQTISGIESGVIQKSAELASIALALGVRWQWLASGELPMVDSGPLAGATPEAIRAAFRSLPPSDQAALLADLARSVAEQFGGQS